MNFKDQWAEDENGEKFVFTIEMQRLLHERDEPMTVEAWLDFKKNHAPQAAPDPKRKREKQEPKQEREPRESAEVEVDEFTGKFIGKLLNYNDRKGFGFIAHGDSDLYFHKKKTLDDPKYFSNGQKLLYGLNTYRGKDEAIDVEEYEEPID